MSNIVNMTVESFCESEAQDDLKNRRNSLLQYDLKDADLSETEVKIVRSEVAADQFKNQYSKRLYAYAMLGLLLSIQISNQWQRFFIGSAYYFNAENKDDPSHYNMGEAIPNFSPAAYSLLSGPVFNTAFSIMVFFTGSFADAYSRKALLSMASMTWSVTSIGTAFCYVLWEVSFCRLFLGLFEAFTAPCAYSLITDFFPAERRTQANSIYALGISVGAAISQLSIILIGKVGWRLAYFIVGSYGLICGFLLLIFMAEPVRGQYETSHSQGNGTNARNPQENEQSEVQEAEEVTVEQTLTMGRRYKMAFNFCMKEPTIRWVLLGGSLRMWASQIIQYFSISYFNGNYDKQLLYPTLSALSILIGGGLSNIIAGRVSDKLEARNYRTKSYVTSAMCLVCSPLCFLCFMVQSSFYFSMSMFFLIYLLSEGWMGPSLAMLQQVVPVEIKAIIIAIFFCSITLSGTLASILVGAWIGKVDNIGLLLMLNTAIPCLIATLCFYKSGKPYAKFLNEKYAEVEIAFSKASDYGNRRMSMQSVTSAEASFDVDQESGEKTPDYKGYYKPIDKQILIQPQNQPEYQDNSPEITRYTDNFGFTETQAQVRERRLSDQFE